MNPRNSYLACVAAVSLLAALPPVLHSQTPKLLVLPASHPDSISEDSARMVEDLLISSLAAGSAFELSAHGRNTVAIDDTSGAVKLASEASAGFVLLSRLGLDSKVGADLSFVLVTRMIAADTGKDLFGRTSRFGERKAIDTLADLAKRLTVAAHSRSDVTVDLVDAFIVAGDWEAARRYLDIYLSSHDSDKPKLEARITRISTGLAAGKNVQARDAAALALYDEAIRAAREATELAPDSLEYRSYLTSLEAEYARYVAQTDAQRLDMVKKYFDDGKIDVAAMLLSRAGESVRTSSRGRNLSEMIDRSERARALALEAEKYLKEYQYPEALAAVDDALKLLPDSTAYIRLRSRILGAEKREAATKERFAAYREELESFDYGSLFVALKPPPKGLALSLGMMSTSMLSSSQSTWNPVERGPSPELAAKYYFPIPSQIPSPFSFTAVSFAADGFCSFGYGVTRSQTGSPVVLVEEQTTRSTLGGGASASLEALSFALRGAADLSLSWLRYMNNSRDPFSGLVSSASLDTWTLGFGLGLSLLWSPVKGTAISIGVERIWPLLCSKPIADGAPTISSIFAGVEIGEIWR